MLLPVLRSGLDIVYTVYIFKIPNQSHNIADSEGNPLFVHLEKYFCTSKNIFCLNKYVCTVVTILSFTCLPPWQTLFSTNFDVLMPQQIFLAGDISMALIPTRYD